MALLQKLKSLLGLGGSDSERRRSREIGVTVEREGTVDDGNGTAAGAAGDQTEDVRADPQSPTADTADDAPAQTADAAVATEPDATASESAGAAETTADADAEPDLEGETEPAVAADSEPEPEPDVETEDTVDATPEPADESEAEQESDPATEAEAEPEPVTEIKGIGPAYADRLAGAGVETVAELAVSDAAELADQTDISEKRIQGWIDRAEVR